MSSDDNQVSVIKSTSMSLSEINEMISGIVLRTDRELMRAAFKGGEVRSMLAITDECCLGCEVFKRLFLSERLLV